MTETENSTVQRIVGMELALVNSTKTDFSHFHTRDWAGKWTELIFHNSEKESAIFRREIKPRLVFKRNSHLRPSPSRIPTNNPSKQIYIQENLNPK